MKKIPSIFLLLILFAETCVAVSIGAGPSTIDYGKLVRGGYGEKEVVISTSGLEDLECTIEYTGEIKDWMSREGGLKFSLDRNSRKSLIFYIQPPIEAKNGLYQGSIYINAKPTSTIESGSGLSVGAGVKIKVSAEITGLEDVSLKVDDIKILDAEKGYPLSFNANVRNAGNVRTNPIFDIIIYDEKNGYVSSIHYSETNVLPMKTEKISFNFPSNEFQVGKYLAIVNVNTTKGFVKKDRIYFNVLDEGSQSIDGRLVKLELSKSRAGLDEIIKVKGKFKNNGVTFVDAKMKTEVYIKDGLSEILEDSDEMRVSPDSEAELIAYFTPKKEGNYIIKSHVLYRGVKTDQKQVILTIAEESSGGSSYIIFLIFLVAASLVYIKYRSIKSNKF